MPVRKNNFFREKIKFKNMYSAYVRASKNKRQNKEVVMFQLDLASNLMSILVDLYNGNYTFSKYREFKVFEPKERIILSLPFRDRVVHQWYVEEFIKYKYMKIFIKDSYACIEGRGLHLALKNLQNYMKKAYKDNKEFYILKCDIQKFFYSINKKILYGILERKYKDKNFLKFTRDVIFQNSSIGEVGIPIGNYTSQYFANIYMDRLDHFVKEKLRVKYYVRYMDDFILLAPSKQKCKELKEEISRFLDSELKLKLNKKTNYFPNKNGVYFCGFRVYKDRILLSNLNKKRIHSKIRKWNKAYKTHKLNVMETAQRFRAWEGHASYETNWVTIKSAIKKCDWIYKENFSPPSL